MTNTIKDAAGVIGVIALFFGGITIGNYSCDRHWQKLLLNKGYGEYSKKTGKWELCEPEVVLLNRNTEAIKILNGGTLTINDYLKVLEFDLKQSQEQNERQTKELLEQDLLIEKYKKNIKLPKEMPKSTKRPLEAFDPSIVVPKN